MILSILLFIAYLLIGTLYTTVVGCLTGYLTVVDFFDHLHLDREDCVIVILFWPLALLSWPFGALLFLIYRGFIRPIMRLVGLIIARLCPNARGVL